jgi:hypothetical protein
VEDSEVCEDAAEVGIGYKEIRYKEGIRYKEIGGRFG